MSKTLYDLTDNDKRIVRAWIKEHKKWNNPAWIPSLEMREGYEMALRHLLYSLEDDGATI